jgi:hypothetical protein
MTRRPNAFRIGLLLAMLPIALNAQLIYGTAYISNGEASSLYTLNPTNGQASLVGAIGFTRVSGITINRSTGILYGVGRSDGIQSLITINTSTGAGTAVGSVGFTNNVTDMAFRQSDQKLYGFDRRSGKIVTFDTTTGAATTVATISGLGSVSALAFSSSGKLYYAHAGTLDEIDPSNGSVIATVTLNFAGVGLNSNSPRINGMDFDPTSGTLWGSFAQGGDSSNPNDYINHLFKIDPLTGAVVKIGLSVQGLESVAVAALPEPATTALMVLGLSIVGFSARWRFSRIARNKSVA